MRRNIGIDLHMNSFTACILQENGEEVMKTWSLGKGDMKRFVATLGAEDEVALEAAGNSAWFCRRVKAYVARVVVIAPSRLELIRRSVNKTDRHDARSIAFFPSRDLLPEASPKSEILAELYSLIGTRGEMVKHRVALLNSMHAMFVRHGVRIAKKKLTGRKGFDRAVASREWSRVEQVEIAAILAQLENVRGICGTMEKEIEAIAKTLPGYNCLTSIRGIGTLSAALFPCTIGDIERFPNLATWLPVLASYPVSRSPTTAGMSATSSNSRAPRSCSAP